MHPRLRSSGLVAVALAWVVPLGACTDDSEDPSTPSGGPHSVALELSLGPGTEDLSAEDRDTLQNDVGALLSTYVVDGFLGDYPREDFVSVLDLFRTSFSARAAEDIDIITGNTFADADKVVATRLEASLSAFAPDGTPIGVSAAVDFAFDVTEGGATREERLSGHLLMEVEDGEWKFFGYRVHGIDEADGATS